MGDTERKLVELGDSDLAEIQAGLHEAFKRRHPGLNDILFPYIATPEASVAAPNVARQESQSIALPSLEQLVVAVPAPEIAKDWEKKGFTNFDFFHLSAHQFLLQQDENYPGWKIKPEPWFWESIKTGRISPDAAKLEGVLVAVDRTQKAQYDGGRQLYQNDPFADLLKRLREEKKIKVPEALKHVPETSRFGISPDELIQHVLPEIAKVLEVDSSAVRLPRAIEFNVIGNLKHPEWGETNTWEWFEDKFGGAYRLFGGSSDDGGLTHVRHDWSDFHVDFIGFRPLVVVSSKA